jgi:glycerol-3-phosphate dehydrogenase subunit B
MQRLKQSLSVEIFEIPTLPPSIPGIRLHRMLVHAIQLKGGRVFDGMQVIAAELTDDGNVARVLSEAAARSKPHQAAEYILATGGLLGGGLTASYQDGLQEQIFNLPVQASRDRNEWFQSQFLSEQPHPIYSCGVQVDQDLHPVNNESQKILNNLRITGSNLSGGDFIRQRSLDGVALLSGYLAGEWV